MFMKNHPEFNQLPLPPKEPIGIKSNFIFTIGMAKLNAKIEDVFLQSDYTFWVVIVITNFFYFEFFCKFFSQQTY